MEKQKISLTLSQQCQKCASLYSTHNPPLLICQQSHSLCQNCYNSVVRSRSYSLRDWCPYCTANTPLFQKMVNLDLLKGIERVRMLKQQLKQSSQSNMLKGIQIIKVLKKELKQSSQLNQVNKQRQVKNIKTIQNLNMEIQHLKAQALKQPQLSDQIMFQLVSKRMIHSQITIIIVFLFRVLNILVKLVGSLNLIIQPISILLAYLVCASLLSAAGAGLGLVLYNCIKTIYLSLHAFQNQTFMYIQNFIVSQKYIFYAILTYIVVFRFNTLIGKVLTILKYCFTSVMSEIQQPLKYLTKVMKIVLLYSLLFISAKYFLLALGYTEINNQNQVVINSTLKLILYCLSFILAVVIQLATSSVKQKQKI